MVALGLAPSRSRAQAMIASGVVTVNGTVATKPSRDVGENAEIAVSDTSHRWVSRAAFKLEHALDAFALTPHGMALDIGASTGGFTQVLLERGAAHVHALDVGHGQLHALLREDARVTVHEGVNARNLPAGLISPPDWITCDASFISLTKVLPPSLELARPGAVLVALIKPQFEAGRDAIGKGGIVKDPHIHVEVCTVIHGFLTGSGWQVQGIEPSPITGSDGNREFLVAASKPGG
jgi:23S rRNA (cytidine1920-2'-O)/16S rRNA (cytidine1409-2'-O)-methyltransferase